MEDHRSALVVLVFILAISAVSSVNTPHIYTVSEEVSRPRHDTVAPASTVDQHSPWVEQVGKHPKVYVFHGFLTDEERRHVLTMAAPEMKRSTVVGNGGAGVVDDIRTSYGMFIRRMADPIIERIERRISLFTQIPVSHQEDIQVLRYEKSQKYDAHYDSSYDGRGGVGPKQRLATLLMYLSDVEEGGETAFPHHSEWADPSIPDRLAEDGVKFSSCAAGHVAAKPKAGDAVLFYSYHANGTMDDASMHAGCPVIKGIKWAAPIWIHIDEFNPPLTRPDKPLQPRDPGVCEDIHPRCSQWASAGECEKNQGFMTGIGTTAPGQCRRACGTCTPCSHLDWACINANRRKGGFLELKKEEMDWLGVKWHARADPSPEL